MTTFGIQKPLHIFRTITSYQSPPALPLIIGPDPQ